MQYVLFTEKDDIPKTAMKKILVIISVVPVLWIFSNNAINWHYHELDCGQVVQHAHPYNKSAAISDDEGESATGAIPARKHSHSSSELITLFMTSGIMLLALSLLVLLFIASEFNLVTGCARSIMIKASTLYRIPLLRAPPRLLVPVY